MSKEEKEETKVVETEVKKEPYTITASYRVKNDADGTFERITHIGTGKEPEEAIASIEDYPKGLNINVLIKVSRGNKESEKSVAPHVARAIMEETDMHLFERNFRGI